MSTSIYASLFLYCKHSMISYLTHNPLFLLHQDGLYQSDHLPKAYAHIKEVE